MFLEALLAGATSAALGLGTTACSSVALAWLPTTSWHITVFRYFTFLPFHFKAEKFPNGCWTPAWLVLTLLRPKFRSVWFDSSFSELSRFELSKVETDRDHFFSFSKKNGIAETSHKTQHSRFLR